MSLEDPTTDVFVENVCMVGPDSPITEAAALMVERAIGCLIISRNKKAIGILTKRDILRRVTRIGADPHKVSVKDVMSTGLIEAPIGTSIGNAAKKMIDSNVRRLVIVDGDGTMAGLLTMTDIVGWMAEQEQLSASLINFPTRDVP